MTFLKPSQLDDPYVPDEGELSLSIEEQDNFLEFLEKSFIEYDAEQIRAHEAARERAWRLNMHEAAAHNRKLREVREAEARRASKKRSAVLSKIANEEIKLMRATGTALERQVALGQVAETLGKLVNEDEPIVFLVMSGWSIQMRHGELRAYPSPQAQEEANLRMKKKKHD